MVKKWNLSARYIYVQSFVHSYGDYIHILPQEADEKTQKKKQFHLCMITKQFMFLEFNVLTNKKTLKSSSLSESKIISYCNENILP